MKVSMEVELDKKEIDDLIIAEATKHAKAASSEKGPGGAHIEWHLVPSDADAAKSVVEGVTVSFAKKAT